MQPNPNKFSSRISFRAVFAVLGLAPASRSQAQIVAELSHQSCEVAHASGDTLIEIAAVSDSQSSGRSPGSAASALLRLYVTPHTPLPVRLTFDNSTRERDGHSIM